MLPERAPVSAYLKTGVVRYKCNLCKKKQKLSPTEMELPRKKPFISVAVPLSWAINSLFGSGPGLLRALAGQARPGYVIGLRRQFAFGVIKSLGHSVVGSFYFVVICCMSFCCAGIESLRCTSFCPEGTK
jgi:hypothetical protein